MKKMSERIEFLWELAANEDWINLYGEAIAIKCELRDVSDNVGKGADRARRNISRIDTLIERLYKENEDFAAVYDFHAVEIPDDREDYEDVHD